MVWLSSWDVAAFGYSASQETYAVPMERASELVCQQYSHVTLMMMKDQMRQYLRILN